MGSIINPDSWTLTASLWDWRRQVADLFAGIRANPDPQAAWQAWVGKRSELFSTHPQTPLDPGVTLPVYFDYDPALRTTVTLGAAKTDVPIYMPAGNDGEAKLIPFAETIGLNEKFGGELTLYWLGGYGGGVFLPFLDGTSGKESYGGGRYLLDTIKSADHGTTPDGKTVLDFNFAYNPSCYYSPRWICPLSPRTNRLTAAIRGGEKAVYA